jgi:hypothetical protein
MGRRLLAYIFFVCNELRKSVSGLRERDAVPLVDDLQFTPNIFEIEETLLSNQPLGRPDGPFGEAAPGLRVMAQIDPVSAGFEYYFVQADDLSLTEGGDLQRMILRAGVVDHILDRDRRAAGRVFLVDVMTLEDLSRVVVAQRCQRRDSRRRKNSRHRPTQSCAVRPACGHGRFLCASPLCRPQHSVPL